MLQIYIYINKSFSFQKTEKILEGKRKEKRERVCENRESQMEIINAESVGFSLEQQEKKEKRKRTKEVVVRGILNVGDRSPVTRLSTVDTPRQVSFFLALVASYFTAHLFFYFSHVLTYVSFIPPYFYIFLPFYHFLSLLLPFIFFKILL